MALTPRLATVLVVAAACLPYLASLDNYFVQDDFGVVALLSSKPWHAFPGWFVSTWMDGIWGYTPDEIRPFPALSYQLAALFGAASPYANHVINIAFHAVNAVLVMAVAAEVAGLSAWPALAAALVFAVLPMQTESVAWITGRVDSMPACFFLASLLMYARWRHSGRRSAYLWAVTWCVVALFTKQNAVTLGPSLVAYDLIIRREWPRPSWTWLRPYVPFIVLTAAYLLLRYALFGEVAREGMLNERQLRIFQSDAIDHLKRMVFGEPGVAMRGARLAAIVVGIAATTTVHAAITMGRRAWPLAASALYFGVVWLVFCVAPTIVAGYASPRHMYLASVGWAIVVALPVAVLLDGGRRGARLVAAVGMAALLTVYTVQLVTQVRLWDVRSAVAHQVVRDLEREAQQSPAGTLVLAVAPRRAFNFAVPHAFRPPFTTSDLTASLRIVMHSTLYCCPPFQWEPDVRGSLRAWTADPSRPPIVVLYWNPDTGAVSRVSDREQPFIRSIPALLLDTRDVATLDAQLLEVVGQLADGSGQARRAGS